MTNIICPCCGHEFAGDLYIGCASCGARAVGEPLARSVHELPSYMPALFVGMIGALMLAAFAVSTSATLIEHSKLSAINFRSIVRAAETAAWHLKWAALPVAVISLWAGVRICALVRKSPARFAGQRMAHAGLAASTLAVLMIAALIGVTVPERLRQRQLGITASTNAQLWTLHRAFSEYYRLHGTFPTRDINALSSLPDPDRSIAAALAVVDPNGYKPTSIQASLPKKMKSLRGAALRNASMSSTNDLPDEGLSFTNYEMTLPGADKILGTPDDVTMRDGVIIETPSPTTHVPSSLSSNDAGTP